MSPARPRSPEAVEELRSSMIGHARAIVARDGPGALTMRALAAEAGCAVGLPYKVFEDRRELLIELVASDFHQLAEAFAEMPARAGHGTVAGNLMHFADLLLGAPTVAFAHQLMADDALIHSVVARTADQGIDPQLFEGHVARYLDAERATGRVGAHVDTAAIGALVFGALHNLLLVGESIPHTDRRQLRRTMTGLANTLAP